jgi:hypothetical protein
MSTVRANNYYDTSGGSNAQLYGVASPPNSMGFRNRIINGDMRIDQRNAGASVTPTATTYTLDRWQFLINQSSKFTTQQSSTAPTGFTNSLLVTSSSAYSVLTGDYFTVRQAIEGLNVADLAWGTASAATVTLSFWVRSSLTGTFGGSIVNDAGNRSYPFTYTINAANTWEQKSVTIAGDTSGTWLTTTGRGMVLVFGFGVGATFSGTAGSWASANYLSATGATSVVGTNGATFYITGVQLEAGTVASPFERRPYGEMLMLCQRYYYRLTESTNNTTFCLGGFHSSTNFQGEFILPVIGRTAPTGIETSSAGTFFVQNASNFTPSAVAFNRANNQIVTITFTVSGGTSNAYGRAIWQTGTAYIGFTGMEL